MNFLAHLYLSGDEEQIILGNFMGDYVKGIKFKKYPPLIQKGIILHRNIDNYTDNHVIVKKSKERFYEKYHKHAGVVVDILYDHFLMKNWTTFSKITFEDYRKKIYSLLESNYSVFPEGVKKFIPSFIQNNWIDNYATVMGIGIVLTKMSNRTSLPNHAPFAIEIIKNHYEEFNDEFINFFRELKTFVNDILSS